MNTFVTPLQLQKPNNIKGGGKWLLNLIEIFLHLLNIHQKC